MISLKGVCMRSKFGAGFGAFLPLGLAVLFCMVFATAVALADRLFLNDGTVLEGTVMKNGDSYWVKTPDGKSQIIPAARVDRVESGNAPAAGSTATPGTAAPTGSANFAATKTKAERVTTPMAAVIIWQIFLDGTPDAGDIDKAKAEMDKWQKMADEGAEKIKGKWVQGEEREAIVKKAAKLLRDAEDAMENNQTFVAMEKLQQSAAIYPNDFQVNYLLGTINAASNHKFDEAIRYFTAASRLRPNSAGAMANIGICMHAKGKYSDGLKMLFKASKIEDSQQLAKSLVVAINMSPPAVLRSASIKPIVEHARLLASRYHINPNENPTTYLLVPPGDKSEEGKDEGGDSLLGKGMVSSGTGFLINDEGLILTNHHVVNGGDTFLVMINKGTTTERRSAELVYDGDEDTDLAILKIKPKDGEKFPFLKLAKYDHPPDAAKILIMGYPLMDRLGAQVKASQGIVSSSGEETIGGADTMLDAKVNPGNSGGPVLDKYGNVMAVVCLKSLATATEDSYGFGISTANVRKFLASKKVTPTMGDESGGVLDEETIVRLCKPATVCILATHGGAE